MLVFDPTVVAVLRWLKSTCGSTGLLVGYTYESYRRLLLKITQKVNLTQIGWTPHSPRSGFASECIANGLGFVKTMKLGRWISEQSLRTYVDIASSAAILVTFKLQHLADALAYCAANLLSFLPGATAFLQSPPCAVHRDASCRLEVRSSGRRLHATPGEDGEEPVCAGGGARSGTDRIAVEDIEEADPRFDPADPAQVAGGAKLLTAPGSRARGRGRASAARRGSRGSGRASSTFGASA